MAQKAKKAGIGNGKSARAQKYKLSAKE